MKLTEKNMSDLLNISDTVKLDYCKVEINYFLSGNVLPYNIFIKLPNGKFIRIANESCDLSKNQLITYTKKGIKDLYLRKKDFDKFIGFSLSVCNSVKSDKEVSQLRKERIVSQVSEIIVERISNAELDQTIFNQTKEFVTNVVEVFSENDNLAHFLEILDESDNYMYVHSTGVLVYSLMISKALGWTSPRTLHKLALTSLFHDIGHKEIPQDILKKSRLKRTCEETILLENHPKKSFEIMQQSTGASEDILQAIYQHHESWDGSGYPHRLRKTGIHPLARIIYLANLLTNYTFPLNKSDAISPKKAIKKIKTFHTRGVDPAHLKILDNILSK